jgi:hypothetical protein
MSLRTNVKQSQHDRLPRRSAPRNDMIATWYYLSDGRDSLCEWNLMLRIGSEPAARLLFHCMEVACLPNLAHHPSQQVSNFIHPFAIGILTNAVDIVIT